MAEVTIKKNNSSTVLPPSDLIQGKRQLTDEEIAVLKANRNRNADESWQNIWVPAEKDNFEATLIYDCEISGFLIIGRLVSATLQFHDLILETGFYHSYLDNVCTGDDVVIRNVAYLSNYRIANRVMLFNVQEISCTCHSKFGNGILKEGEPESNRVWVSVGNENDARAVLPFESMIPADAFLWSRYRDDRGHQVARRQGT